MAGGYAPLHPTLTRPISGRTPPSLQTARHAPERMTLELGESACRHAACYARTLAVGRWARPPGMTAAQAASESEERH